MNRMTPAATGLYRHDPDWPATRYWIVNPSSAWLPFIDICELRVLKLAKNQQAVVLERVYQPQRYGGLGLEKRNLPLGLFSFCRSTRFVA
jgi:hypothetical protein